MTTLSAPAGIMEPVETSAASPECNCSSTCTPMGTLPARRKLTGRSSRASMVSSAYNGKSVHGGAGKAGHIQSGDDLLGQDAAPGL